METSRAHGGAAVAAARRAFADGDVAAAERICREALPAASGNGHLWMVLTETALYRKRLDAALVCSDRAVSLLPHDPLPQVLRAKCLFTSSEPQRALQAAESAAGIARTGASPEALDALGAIFGLLGRHQRAEVLFRQAVTAVPNIPQYLFNLAGTERMLGKFEHAEKHCEAAISADRHYWPAYYLRSDLRTQTPQRNHVTELEALLNDGGVGSQAETLLRFALGKELEDIGEYSRAFGHIAAGCQLQRRSTNYDIAQDVAEIDRIISGQNPSWLAASPAGWLDAAPIFVVGLPRTGTTLVERIIAAHSAVASVGESGAFAGVLQRALKTTPPDLVKLGRDYVSSAGAFVAEGNTRFVDKTLPNYLYCGLIHAALPHAKIILVHRHPVDACWAIYKTLFRHQFLFSYDQIELAEYYLAYRRLARHWRALLPPDAFMEVNYEDFIRAQEQTSRRLIEFLGLPWQDDILRFDTSRAASATASAVQVRRPIYASSVGKWRHYAEQLAPMRQHLAKEFSPIELG